MEADRLAGRQAMLMESTTADIGRTNSATSTSNMYTTLLPLLRATAKRAHNIYLFVCVCMHVCPMAHITFIIMV